MKTVHASPILPRPLMVAIGLLIVLGLALYQVRTSAYRTISGGSSDVPAAHGVIELVASKGLLLLLAITAGVAVLAWRKGMSSFILLLSAGVGVDGAYASSEIIKVLVTEERPCRAITREIIAACPASGDWSWPSNHATIAAALATSCVLVLPRIWVLVAPIAAIIGCSRVAVGVHYPHDVAAGLTLGIIVTCIVGCAVNRAVSLRRVSRSV